jgi:NADPH:quinone reductase-like Zn-dependent oxidoreductase
LGADACFDYKESNVGQKIREYTQNKLYYAFDTISESGSPKICEEALSSNSATQTPKYGAILSATTSREDVKDSYTLGYTILGEFFQFGPRKFEANKDDFEFAKGFMKLSQKLVEDKKIKPHRVELKGGLDDIIQGCKDMKDGKVSGKKMVYVIAKD